MLEQIKELCLFMICGQTLLYFQSGKKYEKICRMILELLVLAGIVGMILNFLQSIGIRKGEMQALGGAVAGMQRSMEEALDRQLDMEGPGEGFMPGISMESLVEKYTMEEIKSQYNYFAEQYGYEIEKAERKDDILQVFVTERPMEGADGDEEASGRAESPVAKSPAGIADMEEVRPVAIEEIRLGEGQGPGEETDGRPIKETEGGEKTQADEGRLETFRRQLALVFAMEEEKLEVILID